jgi:hypothetical protein
MPTLPARFVQKHVAAVMVNDNHPRYISLNTYFFKKRTMNNLKLMKKMPYERKLTSYLIVKFIRYPSLLHKGCSLESTENSNIIWKYWPPFIYIETFLIVTLTSEVHDIFSLRTLRHIWVARKISDIADTFSVQFIFQKSAFTKCLKCLFIPFFRKLIKTL